MGGAQAFGDDAEQVAQALRQLGSFLAVRIASPTSSASVGCDAGVNAGHRSGGGPGSLRGLPPVSSTSNPACARQNDSSPGS